MQTEGWSPPEPPGVQPVKGLPVWRWLIGTILAVALLIAAVFVPIPVVYLYLPGPVRDAEELIDIKESKTYSSEGSLFMTTVSVDTSVSFVELVTAALDKERQVVMKEDVTGGRSLETLQKEQQAQMDESQNHARQVALSELGLDRPTGNGARVEATITGAPADGILQTGDVIVDIDGDPIETSCDVGAVIGEHDTGDRVALTVKRGDSRRVFRIDLEPNPFDGSPTFIGVQMQTVDFSFEPGVEVDFKTGEIAGPSAGLVLALALYDRLTPEDLTAGRKVAGTGTLDCDGGVGPIGGIEQKVAGARAQGAEVFLVPLGNEAAAREVAEGIEIVPIETFDDAIEYLGSLG